VTEIQSYERMLLAVTYSEGPVQRRRCNSLLPIVANLCANLVPERLLSAIENT
jgi:hypothetical protein